MKQKLLYIIMCLICALAWSGEAWGEEKSSYINVTTKDDITFAPSGSNLKHMSGSTASLEKTTTINKSVTDKGKYIIDEGVDVKVTFKMNDFDYYDAVPYSLKFTLAHGKKTNATCWINNSLSSDNFLINITEVTANMKVSTGTTVPVVTMTDANGNSGKATFGSVASLISSASEAKMTGNSLTTPIKIYGEKTGSLKTETAVHITSMKFVYTLSYKELDLQYLDNAIDAATKAKTGKNSTLQKYLQDAIDTANIYRSEFLFPTYISKGHGTAKVDERTERLKVITAYVNALNTAQSYSDDNIPHAVWLLLNQYNGYDPNKFSNTVVNNAKDDLNAAITLAENTKAAYATAISHYNAAVTENTTNHNSNSTIATEIQNAKNDLEASTTVGAITTAQNKFIAIKAKLEAITAFKTVKATAASYNKDNIPDAVYDLLHQYDNDNPYDDYATADVVNSKKNTLEDAIAAAEVTTDPYLTAKNTTLPAMQVQSDNYNPSGIADDDIEDAYEALETATSEEGIDDAVAMVKNFDSITFNGTTSIAMGGSITNPASAESTRSISYSVPNGTTIMNVSGTTLNAVAPGRVTVTATTGSTGEGYYICEKTQEYEILPVFYFSVAAQVGTGGGGSVSLEGNQSSVTGAAWNTPSASLDLKFKATPDNGYVFLGWGTTENATTYESSENPYKPELSNSNVGKANEVNKTLYAIFAPQFFFSATFDKNREGGTVTASVANPTITGAPGDESASTTATFTATATEGSYVFKGWKTAVNAETYVSLLNTYTTPVDDPDLINITPGSMATKTLVAIFAPLYNFSATALVGSVDGGTVSVSGYSAQVEGAPDATEGTTTATFTATPSTDYKFVGWSESDDGEIVSTDNPYSPTLTNKTPGNTESLTLYAIFKLKHIYLSPTTPNYAPGTYDDVTLSRTLKAGYSTIALPFNTTVETLTGRAANDDDWVAQLSVVTYNAKDGYSLYFSKSNAIEANQPYILHLGTAVKSPVFTNVNVVAAEEATKNATNGVHLTDWTMHSNYDPAFDMNGYYGVVNGEDVLKKGSTGSTLKAFHAYIEGPTSAGVKAAYLDEDEADAILVLLKGEATEPENIYDLQGRQLPRAGKGINIIRNADGTVRKVMLK